MIKYIANDELHIKLECSDIAELLKDKYFIPNPSGHWTINVTGSAEIIVPLSNSDIPERDTRTA